MSGAAGMDLRTPIGALFVALGALLLGFGIMSNGDTVMYERATNLNINLVWGGVMLVFGLAFLGLARRSTGKQQAVGPGQETVRAETRP